MKNEKFTFSDETIGRIINVIQEAMIADVDVLDLFRMMQMTSTEDSKLVLTEEYKQQVSNWHKEIEEILRKREAEYIKDHGGVLIGTGDETVKSIGGKIVFDLDLSNTKVN